MHSITLLIYTCLRCGHRWHPRVPEPQQCPRCHSILWRKAKKPKAT